LLSPPAAGGWLHGISPTRLRPCRRRTGRRSRLSCATTYSLTPKCFPRQWTISSERLAGIRDEVETAYPGAVLGNPNGSITLVEFSDFACGFCRKSVEDVERLVKDNPELRVVMRDIPILSEQSEAAARMALAAAEQGKYKAFHDAMFAMGPPDPQTIEAAARAAGLDLEKARAAAGSERIGQEISRSLGHARQLGFDGTPSWVIGDQMIPGAVGYEQLSQAIEEAKS